MDFLLLYCFIPVFFALHVLTHEMAHAVAAWLAGVRVTEVVIGNGTRQGTFFIGRCRVRLTSWPFSGHVIICYARAKWVRMRSILILMAGPLMTAGLSALAFYLMVRWEKAYEQQAPVVLRLLVIFGLTGGWIVVLTLWPRTSEANGLQMPNDAAQVLEFMRGTPEKLREAVFQHQIQFAGYLRERGETERAGRWFRGLARRAARESPHSTALLFASHCYAPPCDPEAVETLRQLVARPMDGPLPSVWAQAADAFACIPLSEERPDLLPEAVAWMHRAVAAFPTVLTYQGTLGSLLAESGDDDGAERLLEKVFKETTAVHDWAICAAYLAILEAKIGNTKISEYYRTTATRLMPNHPIVRRALTKLDAVLEALPKY